jgi:hypothetical protein
MLVSKASPTSPKECPFGHVLDRKLASCPPRRETRGDQMRDLQAACGMILDPPAHEGYIATDLITAIARSDSKQDARLVKALLEQLEEATYFT